tara:strand:- start:210 stop:560 length:351 start_codon:yes stop_codon:yes gene_type:complete
MNINPFLKTQLDYDMISAVVNKIAWSDGNTLTTFDNTLKNCFIYQHGNHIATYSYDNGSITLYDDGTKSISNKNRINALLSQFTFGDVSLYQKNFSWLLQDRLCASPRQFVSGMTV